MNLIVFSLYSKSSYNKICLSITSHIQLKFSDTKDSIIFQNFFLKINKYTTLLDVLSVAEIFIYLVANAL